MGTGYITRVSLRTNTSQVWHRGSDGTETLVGSVRPGAHGWQPVTAAGVRLPMRPTRQEGWVALQAAHRTGQAGAAA